MSYDDAMGDYAHELEVELHELYLWVDNLKDEVISLRSQLSDAHRQISVLQEQLIHYYL
jgi:hypothetical protein